MRGIIIAAGRGLRMLPMTSFSPKCLLPIGDTTLLNHTVELLRNAGCTDIAIVTGHQAELIERNDIVKIRNEDFANNNVLHSLLYAREFLTDDVIISYSDIWVEPEIYQTLLAASGDIVLAVDRDWKVYYQGRTDHPLSEAENVTLDSQGRVLKFGKHLLKADSDDQQFCEFLGLWKMSAAGARQFVEAFDSVDQKLTKLMPFQQAKEWQKSYISDLIQEMVDSGQDIHTAIVERGWAEIDTVQDYKRLPGMTDLMKMHQLKRYLK